jgi:hypothetical protein
MSVYRPRDLRVSPLRRAFCIPLAVLTSAAGFGPYFDGGSFSSAVFDTFRDLFPLTVWGALWLIATVFVVIASATGRWWSYVTAHVLVASLSLFWLIVLAKSRIADDNPVSPTAFGLWAFPVGYCIVALVVPIVAVPVKDALNRGA